MVPIGQHPISATSCSTMPQSNARPRLQSGGGEELRPAVRRHRERSHHRSRRRHGQRRRRQQECWKSASSIPASIDTLTGGRVRRLASLISDGTFMLTYRDGVSDVPLDRLFEFHRSHGRLANRVEAEWRPSHDQARWDQEWNGAGSLWCGAWSDGWTSPRGQSMRTDREVPPRRR